MAIIIRENMFQTSLRSINSSQGLLAN
jgi:hypothetical protein